MDARARRDALVRLLRRGGQQTSEALADALGVSRRTVLRDLATLRDRGFSIRGDGGRGGGVSLDPSTVLLSTQLAADEVVALILSVELMNATPSMPFSALAESALRKIEGVLPDARVRELRRLLGRVLVGAATDTSRARPGSVDPGLLAAFERAFTARLILRFEYTDRNGRRSARIVEPQALFVRSPLWYVVAWDRQRDAARSFRMDRIVRPRVDEASTFSLRRMDAFDGVCPHATPARPSGPSPASKRASEAAWGVAPRAARAGGSSSRRR
jgi:predicted DNA-binding transcriptional regulator YafY